MAAEASRRRASREGWPTGAGLDDSRLDQPGYVPQASWRQAEGTGVAPEDPLERQRPALAAAPEPARVRRPEPEPELEAAG